MSNEIENYDITEHIHRFAVWTAARAAQRGFTTTENISKAIKDVDLQNAFNKDNITSEKFNEIHDKTVGELIKILNTYTDKKGNNLNTSYGRAAKIIAVYLKTAVIIPNRGECEISKVAHPPIDRILLTNLKKKYPEIKNLSWTKFDRTQYIDTMSIINNIKVQKNYVAYWKIEVNWTASDDEKS
jgi:ribosome-binding ATPase YchF (GTP1/OBG family)